MPWSWPTLISRPVHVVARDGATVADLGNQLATAPPEGEAATVSIGTNDMLSQAPDLTALPDLLAEMESRYGRVAVIDALPPLWPSRYWITVLRPHRVAVRAALEATGRPVIHAVLPPWAWASDRIHPNKGGHRRLAVAVERWLP